MEDEVCGIELVRREAQAGLRFYARGERREKTQPHGLWLKTALRFGLALDKRE